MRLEYHHLGMPDKQTELAALGLVASKMQPDPAGSKHDMVSRVLEQC